MKIKITNLFKIYKILFKKILKILNFKANINYIKVIVLLQEVINLIMNKYEI